MLLAELVATSEDVAATSARNGKIAALAAAPVSTRRVLGSRVAMTAFGGGLLVVSDDGAWWYGAVSL